jgi:hypothetical protein
MSQEGIYWGGFGLTPGLAMVTSMIIYNCHNDSAFILENCFCRCPPEAMMIYP